MSFDDSLLLSQFLYDLIQLLFSVLVLHHESVGIYSLIEFEAFVVLD
jgi:hypothetical protein